MNARGFEILVGRLSPGLRAIAVSLLTSFALSCRANEHAGPATSSSSAASAATSLPEPIPPKPRIRVSDQNIDHIVLDRLGNSVVRLEKRGGRWVLTSSELERAADVKRVEQLFSDLESTEIVQPLREPMRDFFHVVMTQGEVTVLDLWVSYRPNQQRGSLVRFQGSDEIWFARGIAPWIYFATDEDFGLGAP